MAPAAPPVGAACTLEANSHGPLPAPRGPPSTASPLLTSSSCAYRGWNKAGEGPALLGTISISCLTLPGRSERLHLSLGSGFGLPQRAGQPLPASWGQGLGASRRGTAGQPSLSGAQAGRCDREGLGREAVGLLGCVGSPPQASLFQRVPQALSMKSWAHAQDNSQSLHSHIYQVPTVCHAMHLMGSFRLHRWWGPARRGCGHACGSGVGQWLCGDFATVPGLGQRMAPRG